MLEGGKAVFKKQDKVTDTRNAKNQCTNEAGELHQLASGVWRSCKENGKPLEGAGVVRRSPDQTDAQCGQ